MKIQNFRQKDATFIKVLSMTLIVLSVLLISLFLLQTYEVIDIGISTKILKNVIILIFLSFAILLVLVMKIAANRSIGDLAQELEEKFEIYDYSSAKIVLENRGIIKGDKLIICDSALIDEISVDINKCYIFFDYYLENRNLVLKFEFYDSESDEILAVYDLDNYLLSYFSQDENIFENKDMFLLFLNNKKQFVKRVY